MRFVVYKRKWHSAFGAGRTASGWYPSAMLAKLRNQNWRNPQSEISDPQSITAVLCVPRRSRVLRFRSSVFCHLSSVFCLLSS